MTTWLEGERSFFLGAQAFLIDNDREMASSWASKHVIQNPAYKWVLGRFVEADRANNNKQLFTLAGLQMARPTITHAPMNMNHSARRVVGSYVATDLIYPAGAPAMASEVCPNCGATKVDDVCPNCGMEGAAGDGPAVQAKKCPSCGKTIPVDAKKCEYCEHEMAERSDLELNPYIEALGVFWKHYFPEDYALVEDAHAEGRLYYSMECIPRRIQCAGADGCGTTYEYAGRISDTYCAHLKEHVSDKLLIEPHFTAGAILVPPVRPGWSHADVHSLVARHAQLAENIYTGVQADMAHLDANDWESIMGELLVLSSL